MLSENFYERVQILGRFQAIEIVQILTQIQPGCPEFIPTLPVTYSGAAPIVALEQTKGAIKAYSRTRRRLLRSPERIAQTPDHFSSPLSFAAACSGERYNFSPLALSPLPPPPPSADPPPHPN